ncbi:helix-turn-helix domain-containing protein [Mycobacterium sp. ITM-2016-00317]|uniref:winged helix-turn-helix transcriptional regulator n=1 Tax=Mycobacterium sp. ITM-2016-00317 TaxID=2099694 RepID=UPI000D3F727C|nr:helix-turn-helix domain-containing protein [Mycobacterium sp. ITM-2016-00317]WNG89716.1 helix-turn-helix domain-containing protein [Mycobacterium sp. ITM-2016-00317]
MRHDDLAAEPCSILRPLALLGDRWTLVVLRQSFAGVRRFEDFQAGLGLSRAVLAERLQRLVDAGVLQRHAYRDDRRTRQEYRLTDKGRDLYPVLMALRAWGDKYLAPDGPFVEYRHRGCGGHTHTRLLCDTCGDEITAAEVEVGPGPGLAASLSGRPTPA